jgi:hypothetical protein
MNKVTTIILTLFLLLLLAPNAVTNTDDSNFNPMADVNRDGIVDVSDLGRLGQAYGSTGLVHEAGKTVISVWNETAPVEDAVVHIVPFRTGRYNFPDNIGYTDSNGTSTFMLGSDANYTAIAWFGSDYNYANITTNLAGEASALVMISGGMKCLPFDWVTFSLVNKTTGRHIDNDYWHVGDVITESHTLAFNETSIQWYRDGLGYFDCYLLHGLAVSQGVNLAYGSTNWGVKAVTFGGLYLGNAVYNADEKGNANVVIYV